MVGQYLVNLGPPMNLKCMLLKFGRKPAYPEKTHKSTKRNMLNARRNCDSSLDPQKGVLRKIQSSWTCLQLFCLLETWDGNNVNKLNAILTFFFFNISNICTSLVSFCSCLGPQKCEDNNHFLQKQLGLNKICG